MTSLWNIDNIEMVLVMVKAMVKVMVTNLQNRDKVEIFRAARVYCLSSRQYWPAIIMINHCNYHYHYYDLNLNMYHDNIPEPQQPVN